MMEWLAPRPSCPGRLPGTKESGILSVDWPAGWLAMLCLPRHYCQRGGNKNLSAAFATAPVRRNVFFRPPILRSGKPELLLLFRPLPPNE